MLDMYEMENKIVEHLRSVFYLLQKANSIVINVLAVEVLFIYIWPGYIYIYINKCCSIFWTFVWFQDLSEYVIIPSTLKHESFMFEKLRELRVREGGICESGIEKSNEILNNLLNNNPSMETWYVQELLEYGFIKTLFYTRISVHRFTTHHFTTFF